MSARSRSHSAGRPGFVLVSVLMLGTVLISCATALAWTVRSRLRAALREREALTERSMAQTLALATMEAVAAISSRTDADSPIQEWFQPFLFPADELGLWAVQVTPLDDKIPIAKIFLPDGNNLRGELRGPWEEMWEALGHRELATPALDFLDKDAKPRVGGVEQEGSLDRPPLDLSEMLLMEGVGEEILRGGGGRPGLADLCTVWSDGKINLNVAPVEVLRLLPGLGGGAAELLVGWRAERTLRSMADVRGIPGIAPRAVAQLTNIAAFKSRYHVLRIEALDDDLGVGGWRIVFDRTEKRIVHWEGS